MKRVKTNKKSRKNLALILGGSLVALLVVGLTISYFQQSQTVESQATNMADYLDSLKQRRVKIEGGLGTGEFDAPTQLFAPVVCPGATTDEVVSVFSEKLGEVAWACDPQAGFHFSNPTYGKIKPGITVTLTPPTGYTCSGYSVYISTAKELRYKKEAKKSGTGCTAKAIPGVATKSMFVWFTVVPKAN